MATEIFAGPVSHAVFVVPRDADITQVVDAIAAAELSGTVEVLDLEVVALGPEGAARVTALDDPRLAEFETALTGLLDAEDFASLTPELTRDDYAVIVVYEDRGLAAVAAEVHMLGGRELWTGGIALEDLEAAIADHPGEE